MSADAPRMPQPPAIVMSARPPNRVEVKPPVPPEPPMSLACMVEVRPGARVFDLGPVRDSMMESTGHVQPTTGLVQLGELLRLRDGHVLVCRKMEHAYLLADVTIVGRCAGTELAVEDESPDGVVTPWVEM